MSGWHEGRVTHTERAAEGLFDVHIDVAGTPAAGAHTRPGQYVRLRMGDAGEGVFAIASGPHQRDGHTFELLVKSGSALADALIAARPGTRVELTEPEGPGFPLEAARGKPVLLFATGSGISAIRSVIEAIRRDRAAFGQVTLYFGARTPGAFAYQREFAAWERGGIHVVRTVSQYGTPGWEGLQGYVQHHLPAEGLTDSVAFVCGQEQMVAAVREALVARGVRAEQIFLNL